MNTEVDTPEGDRSRLYSKQSGLRKTKSLPFRRKRESMRSISANQFVSRITVSTTNKNQSFSIRNLVITFIITIIALPTIFLLSIAPKPGTDSSTIIIALFASLETIVSAFAFYGLLKSLQMQREDIQLQREEMTETRKVFEEQKRQMELQNEQLKEEHNINQFYTRYKLFLEVIESMRKEDYSGRRLLFTAGEDCRYTYQSDIRHYENNELWLKALSINILAKYGPYGLYWFFPSLNNLFHWCESQSGAKKFIKIILDEFNTNDKRGIYYIVYFDEQFVDLRERLTKNGFLESLSGDVFLSDEHRSNPPHLRQ